MSEQSEQVVEYLERIEARLDALVEKWKDRKEVFTISEAAEFLNVSRSTVQGAIDTGKLVARNVGAGRNRVYRITRRALDQFLDAEPEWRVEL